MLLATEAAKKANNFRHWDLDVKYIDWHAEDGQTWLVGCPGRTPRIFQAVDAPTAQKLWDKATLELWFRDTATDQELFGFVPTEVEVPTPHVERVWPVATCARAGLALRLLWESLDSDDDLDRWGVLRDSLLEVSEMSSFPDTRRPKTYTVEWWYRAWRRVGQAAVEMRRKGHPAASLLPPF